MARLEVKNRYKTTQILFYEEGATLVRAVSKDGEKVILGLYSKDVFPKAKEATITYKRKAIESLKPLAIIDSECAIIYKDEEGENYLSKFSRGGLNDSDFDELFRLYKFCRFSKVGLDYHPENFLRTKSRALYLSYKNYPISETEPFEQKGIFLYFHSKEGVAHLKEKGYYTPDIRVKDEKVVNKEVVLCVVKAYQ